MRKLLFIIIFTAVLSVHAQSERNLLCGNITPDQLKSFLIPPAQFHPFSKISEREELEKIPLRIRELYIIKGNEQLKKKWEVLPASVFLDFKRNGNRTKYEAICFGRRKRLMTFVMAELFENKGRFLDEIANGIWLVCEETYWGIPAHVGSQKKGTGLPDVDDPTIDLFAAETGAMLAYINYLMQDKLASVSPLLPERIKTEEERRIYKPYLDKDAWWKTGTNNWNPWINSNVLAAILLIEMDINKRDELIYKTMKSVDCFINSYPEDGGCDEGPNYWSRAAGSLFDYLELLNSATEGKINLYNNPLFMNMGQFIYKTWINGNYFINFADASAIAHPDGYAVYRFGKRINDSLMMGFGVKLVLNQKSIKSAYIPEYGSLNTLLPNLFVMNEVSSAKAKDPYILDTWLSGLQVMAARSERKSSAGFYIAAKGGNNAESHNHNDVGNFILYYNGKPVIIDVGVETYTSKTFSSKRYEIWTMQSQYHNLPTVNGFQQKEGEIYKAENVKYYSAPEKSSFSLDLKNCYPADAGIISLRRKIDFIRGSKIILNDTYSLSKWKSAYILNLMSCLGPDCSKKGEILLKSGNDAIIIKYDGNIFSASSELIKIDDARLTPVWGDKLYRIVLKAAGKEVNGEYSIEFISR